MVLSYFKSLSLILLFLITSCSNSYCQIDVSNTLLWYTESAKSWNEALPIGNGKMGAMIFGKTDVERIQLNDDSMWPENNDSWNEPQGNKNDLKIIRQHLLQGEGKKADSLFVEKFSRKEVIRSHQTLGDLFIDFNHQNVTDYKRSLDLENAIATVSYKTDGHLFTEEVFASYPHNVMVIKLSSESPRGISCKITMNRPLDEGFQTAKTRAVDNHNLIMQGEVTQRGGKFDSKPYSIINGVKFQTHLKVETVEGKVKKGDQYLELINVKTAYLFLVCNTSYYFEDYIAQNRLALEELDAMSYTSIRNEHTKDYKNLYSRVDFQLLDLDIDSIATNVRLENVSQGKTDLKLQELLFQYGRYLLISSSRLGSNPANLQGLWNEHITAPWNADYHLNINLQMNYWPANITGLGELNLPLFEFLDKLIENGKITASKNFGCRGAFIPHATDLWAPTWLRAPTAYWGCSVGAGGWLMQHYWEQYAFSKDTIFLRERVFPALQEVALFYSDWLITDPRDGYLISAPSTSPENRYYNGQGEKIASCLGSAMDQQIIFEVFTNYLNASKILNIQNDHIRKINRQIKKLRPGFVIGSNHRILEWDREYEEVEPGHRHMSHLYGFHPGNMVSKTKTPDLFEAVKNTLEYRLDNGGAGTGWSRAWLINCSARLLQGDMAHHHITQLLSKSMSKNLFDLHPPFQIDGNFGYTAGVAEMLLQSHEHNLIRVLPALPKAWKDGHIKGLKARGGLTFDIYWSNGKLYQLNIKASHSSKFKLLYDGTSSEITMNPGEIRTLEY